MKVKSKLSTNVVNDLLEAWNKNVAISVHILHPDWQGYGGSLKRSDSDLPLIIEVIFVPYRSQAFLHFESTGY